MFHVTRKHWMYSLSVVLLLAIGFGLAVWLYEAKIRIELTSFTITMLTAIVSLVALFIALQTYLSIDSVNNVSKMEGNILDNEYYVTSVPELINNFKEQEIGALREAILSSIQTRILSQSKTAVDFADTLQYAIDLLVFFPSFKVPNSAQKELQETAGRIEDIVKNLYRRLNIFQAVSKGNVIQMKEAVKLIEAVIVYQRQTQNANLNLDTAILSVRGPILRNAVAATVYYNYLGLYYRRSAIAVLEKAQDENVNSSQVDSVENLKRSIAQAKSLQPDNAERIRRLLKKAMQAFDAALKLCVDDPMWRGYILFNQARTAYMQQAYLHERNDALEFMREAISARSVLNELVSSILGNSIPAYKANSLAPDNVPATILQKHYWYQQEYSEQLYVNYCKALGVRTINYRNEPLKDMDEYRSKVSHYLSFLTLADRIVLTKMSLS